MRALQLVTGLALTVALVGCSSDDGKKADEPKTPAASSTPSGTPDETGTADSDPKAALEAAYRTYVDAYLTGDGATAYAAMSKKCQDAQPLSEFAASAEAAGELYGDIDYTIDSIVIDGDHGKVNATYPVDNLNQGGGSEWIIENGAWKMDRC